MMTSLVRAGLTAAAFGCGVAVWAQAPVEKVGGKIDLPSSKQIVGVVPGDPKGLTSTPVGMAVSPDGRWVVTVNGGYGSYEGGYAQSLAVLDTTTGKVQDFPDERTVGRSGQVLFSGLAFSGDGKRLYGSIDSLTDATGSRDGDTGSGVQVYGFDGGKLTRERVIKIPAQKLAAGKTTKLGGGRGGAAESAVGVPYPAGIAVLPGQTWNEGHTELIPSLLVADNLSDDVVQIDTATGKVIAVFDVSESKTVPGTYPDSVAVAKDGKRAFVGLWNSSEVVELNLVKGTVGAKLNLLKADSEVKPSSHPTALVVSPDGNSLYVSLGNRDAVAAVDLTGGGFKLKGYYDVRLPGQSYYGAIPEALALNADGSRLYVANLGSDAVAVVDTKKLTKGVAEKGMVEPVGFIPTEWMPTGVAFAGGKIFIASGKGTGTGPNNFPQKQLEGARGGRPPSSFTYIANLLHGSVATVDEKTVEGSLKVLTAEVLEDNRMKAAQETIAFKGGTNPIKHVIYIIRENRTYDQLLGDLPVGNGDKSLTMYGAEVTPNLHKLALQFGVLDNFYDSGEVSGDGHVWSNSAINSDYNERTWQLNYRGSQRGYDYEGVVSAGIPLEQHIPDVAEPGTGYVWGNADKNGRTHYNFGEFIASTFCSDRGVSIAQKDSQMGPLLEGETCATRTEVKPGEKFPKEWGGEANKWPWAIPLLAANKPTKPELVGHFAPEYPDFNLKVPDQLRVNVFVKHLTEWAAGNGEMPNYITMRLGNDHTAGTAPGGPTPKASVADNDLAVGRIVEAISHSKFWEDTAICVLEDDAQNGADHVDAHRSIALVVSKYAPRAADGGAFVDSRFYSTVSMIRTMETLLGLPPMNNNDAFSSMIGSEFTGAGDQGAFTADVSNRENGLIYAANQRTAPGARASAKMDFRHEDRADPMKLNVILWEDAMGTKPVPAMLLVKQPKKKDADD